MRLSPHFHSSEFDCHDGTPVPHYALDDLTMLCRRYLEPVRRKYGPVRIVSGYRTRLQNTLVGGAPFSYHIYQRDRRGAAADFVAARGTPTEWAQLLEDLGVPGLGRYDAHVHADNRAGHARW